MVITYVYPNESESWENIEWRCIIPAEAINRTGIHKANLISETEFATNSNICITSCLESDLIVIYKKIYGRVISAIHHWQAREKTIIVDFDEAYQLLDPESDEYHFWFEGMQRTKDNAIKYISPSPMTQFKWGLKLVDGITVPTNRLANDWLTFNDIAVIPDYIFPEQYAVQNRSTRKKSIVMGWHGKKRQFTRINEFGLLDAIREIITTHKNVFLKIYLDDEFGSEQPFEANISIFENVKKRDWRKALPGIDIGLVPVNGACDQRQPDRTVLEYLLMKIPWIASQGTASHEFSAYGSIVDNTKENWISKIEELITFYDDYKSQADHEPYLIGLERSVDENIHHTIKEYEKFLQSRKRQQPIRSEEL